MDAVVFEGWHLGLIDELRVARFASVTELGAPHVVPVCFAYVDGRFAIAIDEKPKATTRLARLRNIAHEPRVSLLLDRYDDDWERLAWVRIDGRATVIERGDSRPAELAALRERYRQYRGMDLETRPLILIEPSVVAGWRWQSG